jgi:hypothetical protein
MRERVELLTDSFEVKSDTKGTTVFVRISTLQHRIKMDSLRRAALTLEGFRRGIAEKFPLQPLATIGCTVLADAYGRELADPETDCCICCAIRK